MTLRDRLHYATWMGLLVTGLLLAGQYSCQMPLRTAQAQPAPIVMSVDPATPITLTADEGGPATPATFTYSISTNRGNTTWFISGLPTAWMRASITSGRTPATVNFTVDSSKLAAGTYAVALGFVNLQTHRGDTSRQVTLTVKPKTPVTQSTWSISATPAPTFFVRANDQVTFTYQLANTGLVLIANAAMTSNLGAPNCALQQIPIGGVTPCSLAYVVTQADQDAGQVTAQAQATATNAPQIAATTNVNIFPEWTLTATATPPTFVNIGDAIAYKYILRNTGYVAIPANYTISSTLTDNIPAVSQPIVAPADASCSAIELLPGSGLECTVNYAVRDADIQQSYYVHNEITVKNASNTPEAQTAFIDVIKVETSGYILCNSPAVAQTNTCVDDKGNLLLAK